MRQHKTEAIILDTTDVFDADRSFLMFSREFGKIRARAKGVRRPTSRLTGHLLAYLPVQVELVESGGWFLITDAQLPTRYLQEDGNYPANTLGFLQKAALVAEGINRLFIDQDPHVVIYDGLSYTLDRLRDLCDREGERASQKGESLAAEFLLKCLAELGYRPELRTCVLTGQPLDPEFIAWSSELGGVLSKEGYQRHAATDAFIIQHPRSVVALRQFLTEEFWAERLAAPDEVQEETNRIIYHYLQTQIGQPLRSLIVSRR